MISSYKRLGDYIQEVNIRNKDLKQYPLLGVSIRKEMMTSIANTVGTDMSTYKIIQKNQFAYGPVTSRNGDKISIALSCEEKALLSQAYVVFETNNELLHLPNVLATPHSAAQTKQARFRVSLQLAEEIFRALQKRTLKWPVNKL